MLNKIGNMKAIEIIEKKVNEFMFNFKDQEVVRPVDAGDDGLIKVSLNLYKRLIEETFGGVMSDIKRAHFSKWNFVLETVAKRPEEIDGDYCEVIYAPKAKFDFEKAMKFYKETGMLPATPAPQRNPMMETYINTEIVSAIPMFEHEYQTMTCQELSKTMRAIPGYMVLDIWGNKRWESKEKFELTHRKLTEQEKRRR